MARYRGRRYRNPDDEPLDLVPLPEDEPLPEGLLMESVRGRPRKPRLDIDHDWIDADIDQELDNIDIPTASLHGRPLPVDDEEIDRALKWMRIPVAKVRRKSKKKLGKKAAPKVARKSAPRSLAVARKPMSVARAKRLIKANRGRGRPTVTAQANLNKARQVLGLKPGAHLGGVRARLRRLGPKKPKKPLIRFPKVTRLKHLSKKELISLVKSLRKVC